ncbi:hypothetical protein V6N11_017548 [Hibiscus sabdariffa]|uniref:DUF4283 domain-containing protein n=1 Tax=Hibiscus sabdariffa TaxID=183260 RepID=A0ABR2TYD3_9ROSI
MKSDNHRQSGRVVSLGTQDRSKSRKGVAVFINYERVEEHVCVCAVLECDGSNECCGFGKWQLMDGFRIRTFSDRRVEVVSRSLKNSGGDVSRLEKLKRRDVVLNKGIDEQTYKEALMTNTGEGNGDEVRVKIAKGSGNPSGDIVVGSVATEAVQIATTNKDQSRLKQCLVGQINPMYDPKFVQQVLVANGFRVKVSSWSGFYVVIQFEEVEQMDIFWDLKESVLKPWFEEIDTVERFMKEQKLKVWVSLEGIPLEAWSESTMFAIGSCWGRVIQIDSDTVERKLLDKARLLLGVKCLPRIPPQISLVLKGVLYFLKVSCSTFEDEHCWIDGKRPNSDLENPPKEVEKGHDLGDSFSSDQPIEEQLYEVHVEGGVESNTSSGHIVSIEPILDPVSGLYSITPKLITRSKRNNLVDLCSSLINRPSRVGFSPLNNKGSNWSQEAEIREARHEKLLRKADGGESSQKGDTSESNARIKEVEGLYELLEQKLAGGIVDSLTVSDLKEARGKLWALIRREE